MFTSVWRCFCHFETDCVTPTVCVVCHVELFPQCVPYFYYKCLLLQSNSSVCCCRHSPSLTLSLARPLPLLGSVSRLSIVPLCCLYPPRLLPSRGMADLPLASDPSGTRRGRARASPEFRRLASPRTARAAFPRCSLPTGIPSRDNGAAYQGKQHPPRCQPATKTQTEGKKGRTSANIVQHWLVEGRKRRRSQPQCTKPSQTHPSQCFRRLESMATQSRSQYVIVAPAASLI